MRRKWLALLAVLFLIGSVAGTVLAQADSGVLQVVQQLEMRHPRRGHQVTLVGDKVWVTGGKAYYSHFLGWGKDGHAEFTTYPNAEVIDLAAGTATYTTINTGKDFYKATAFTTADDSPFLYLAGDGKLQKLDTDNGTLTRIANVGEKGDWQEAPNWGRLTIRGKKYVVLAGDKRLFFFDPDMEKFVKPEGVDTDNPAAKDTKGGTGACFIGERLYVFGGLKGDDTGSVKAWRFDPAAAPGSQWSRLADMPVGIDTPKVEAVGGKAYLIGGGNAGALFKTIYAYDPATDSYERKSNLPFEVRNHETAVVGNDIWISWGYSWGTDEEGKLGFRMHPPHLVRYSPAKDTATLAATGTESVKGDKMNLSLTWPDADAITGPAQTVAINWTAATSSTRGVVYYRKVGEEAFSTAEGRVVQYAQAFSEAKAYTAILSQLPPATEIEYVAVSEGPARMQSETYRYTTQPAAPGTFQLMVYGDSKAQYDVLHELNVDLVKKLREGLEKGLPGWVLQLGDFGAFGAMSEWDAWFNYGYNGRYATREMTGSFAFLPVHGNHELLSASWFNTFETPKTAMKGWPSLHNRGFEERWYSLNYGPLHLAVITTGEYASEEWYKTQYEWLKADLAYARKEKEAGRIRWILVAMHHPVFTSGEHFLDQDIAGLDEPGWSYVDAIEANGAVDMVLTAHDHDYERTKSITGYRWNKDKDGKLSYIRRPGASAVESSGRFGTVGQGKGIVWVVLGGAGAGERDMYRLADLGDSSWLAFRKPDSERKEKAETHPAFHYGMLTISPDALKLEVFEKSVAYLPDWKGADDDFTGLLDTLTITR